MPPAAGSRSAAEQVSSAAGAGRGRGLVEGAGAVVSINQHRLLLCDGPSQCLNGNLTMKLHIPN